MTNLTKGEIVKLRAKAMCIAHYHKHGLETLFNKTALQYAQDEWHKWVEEAEATIEADEKAGVLILVEEGDRPEVDDVITYTIDNIPYADVVDGRLMRQFDTNLPPTKWEPAQYWDDEWHRYKVSLKAEIVRRANTLVYQCKNERKRNDIK